MDQRWCRNSGDIYIGQGGDVKGGGKDKVSTFVLFHHVKRLDQSRV